VTTVVLLKVLHYLSLFLAGGLGVANVMLFKNHQKAGMPPPPPVQTTMMTLARLGLISIIILWLTGIPLTYKVYGSFDLGWPFHLKLLGATSLIGAVAFLNLHLTKQAKDGKPPNTKVMKIVPPVARASLVVVLVGVAVLTTST
jgi:uncharacterized membrane protein